MMEKIYIFLAIPLRFICALIIFIFTVVVSAILCMFMIILFFSKKNLNKFQPLFDYWKLIKETFRDVGYFTLGPYQKWRIKREFKNKWS